MPCSPSLAGQRARAHSACTPGVSDANSFRVPPRYRFLRHLGSGSYGTVASFYDTVRSREVAIKRVRRVFDNFLVLRRTLREIRLMRHFRHPNLMRIHKVLPLDGAGDLYLSLELMDCDLDTLVHARQVSLNDQQVRRFSTQMLLGLLQLHSAHVLHRDLKPANIFVRLSRGQVKIGDLGLSRGIAVDGETMEATHPSDEQLTEYVVTRWYRAPEVLLARSKYGPPVDVWSVGCIIYEMWGRKALFPGKNSYDQLKRVFTVLGMPSEEDAAWVPPEARPLLQKCAAVGGPGSVRSEAWEALCSATTSKEGMDLLLQMTKFDPWKRISVEGSLQHPYLANFNSDRDRCFAKETSPADVAYDRLYDGIGRGGEQAALLQLGRMLRQEVSEERVQDVTPDHSPAPHSARSQRSQNVGNSQTSCEDASARPSIAAGGAAPPSSLGPSVGPVKSDSARRLSSQASELHQRIEETAAAAAATAIASMRAESARSAGLRTVEAETADVRGRRNVSRESSRLAFLQQSKLLENGSSGCSTTASSSGPGSATTAPAGTSSVASSLGCGGSSGHLTAASNLGSAGAGTSIGYPTSSGTGSAGGGGGGSVASMNTVAVQPAAGGGGGALARRLPNPVVSSTGSLGSGNVAGQLPRPPSGPINSTASAIPAPARRRSADLGRATTGRALPEPPTPQSAVHEATASRADVASAVFAAAAAAAQEPSRHTHAHEPPATARRASSGAVLGEQAKEDDLEHHSAKSSSLSRMAIKRRVEATPSAPLRRRSLQVSSSASLPSAEKGGEHHMPAASAPTLPAAPSVLPAPPRSTANGAEAGAGCGGGGYPELRRHSDSGRSSSRHSQHQPGTGLGHGLGGQGQGNSSHQGYGSGSVQRYPSGGSKNPFKENGTSPSLQEAAAAVRSSFFGVGPIAAATGSPRPSAPMVPSATAPSCSSGLATAAATAAAAGGTGSTRFEMPAPPGETGCTPLYQGSTVVLGGGSEDVKDTILPYAARAGVRASRTPPGRTATPPGETMPMPLDRTPTPLWCRPNAGGDTEEKDPYDDMIRGAKASMRHHDAGMQKTFVPSASSRPLSSRHIGLGGSGNMDPAPQHSYHGGGVDRHVPDTLPSSRRHDASAPRLTARGPAASRNPSTSDMSDNGRAGSFSSRRRRPAPQDELDFAVSEPSMTRDYSMPKPVPETAPPTRRQSSMGMPQSQRQMPQRRTSTQWQATYTPRQRGEVPLPPWLEPPAAMPAMNAPRTSRRGSPDPEADTSPTPSSVPWLRRTSPERLGSEERQWRSLQHSHSVTSVAGGRPQRRPLSSGRMAVEASSAARHMF